MVDATYTSFAADDRSYFSLTRREIHRMAKQCGIPEARLNEIDIIVSELTSNLEKHTIGGGEILAGIFDEDDNCYLEIICIDNGPGFRNIEKMMADGYSSSGTLGQGLGSIKRLSDVFDVYSLAGWGTLVLSRVYKEVPVIVSPARGAVIFKPLVVAKPREKVSGDGSFIQRLENGFKVLVADGLGHGPDANHAVNEAVKAFRECTETTAANTIRHLHQAIKTTRGVVANVIFYQAHTRTWCAAGVGNIDTKWIGGLNVKPQMCYNGIVGHNLPNTINDVCLPQQEYQQFIACSDGIRSRWEPTKLPMITRHDPIILAAAIYKEYARRTDDMSVVICKVI